MMRLALGLLLVATTLVFAVPATNAAICGTDTSSGVAVTCHVNGETCTATVDGGVAARCDPPLIVCIRDPCP